MKKQTKWIAVLLMVCLMLTGFTGCAVKTVSVGDEKTQENVTVSATGTVQLVPDMASVTFSVMTKEATAQQAQEKNSETVQNVTETLVQKGVEEKSIRTSNYSMYPQYDYGEGERILTGYIVSTTITVQDQLIENVGQLLSDCVAAGVNSIDSVVFLCSGYDEAYAQALGLAVEDA